MQYDEKFKVAIDEQEEIQKRIDALKKFGKENRIKKTVRMPMYKMPKGKTRR